MGFNSVFKGLNIHSYYSYEHISIVEPTRWTFCIQFIMIQQRTTQYTHNIPTVVHAVPPEDEQAVLETLTCC
jgi:hypothetical protein